jgi:hypothetical protein
MDSMKPIARRGATVAWAPPDFDPKSGDVELRTPGEPTKTVKWQQALKFGYWEDA